MTEKTVVVAKPFVLFGAGVAEELLFNPYDRSYINDLPFTAAHDRIDKAYRTARGSLASSSPNDVNRGKFAALDLAAGVSHMAEHSPQEAAKEAPLVSEVAAQLPDTDEGARIAEQVVAVGLQPAVDQFNEQVVLFRQ
jgi:hypothetical protein